MINMKSSKSNGTMMTDGGDTPDQPAYPYGLEIRLDDEGLKKLGIKTPPAVGTRMDLCAMVTVVSARQEQVKDGTDTSVSLQITDMDLAASVAGTDAAKVLFGKE